MQRLRLNSLIDFLIIVLLINALAGVLYLASLFFSSSNRRLEVEQENIDINTESAKGLYVGSINGVLFYPPDCKAAQRIKEDYKIIFFSEEEARLAGYRPAESCF